MKCKNGRLQKVRLTFLPNTGLCHLEAPRRIRHVSPSPYTMETLPNETLTAILSVLNVSDDRFALIHLNCSLRTRLIDHVYADIKLGPNSVDYVGLLQEEPTLCGYVRRVRIVDWYPAPKERWPSIRIRSSPESDDSQGSGDENYFHSMRHFFPDVIQTFLPTLNHLQEVHAACPAAHLLFLLNKVIVPITIDYHGRYSDIQEIARSSCGVHVTSLTIYGRSLETSAFQYEDHKGISGMSQCVILRCHTSSLFLEGLRSVRHLTISRAAPERVADENALITFFNMFVWSSLETLVINYSPRSQHDFTKITNLHWSLPALGRSRLHVVHLDFPTIDLQQAVGNNHAQALKMAGELSHGHQDAELTVHGRTECPLCALNLGEKKKWWAYEILTRGPSRAYWKTPQERRREELPRRPLR
jgi:hypothetical protein